ncbi:hypothetical protein FF38_12906 [Lucilia cuprina]|uniref:Chemosensory protein n=1 Tax=Lucilia cuprina TaxID=7375 RepID=A0A0L0BQC4_LUCCU|nr:hypothetical protein FF38_12906 [Lucilia cuprina]
MKPIMSRVVMSFMIYLFFAAVVVNCDEKNINKLLNNQVIVSRQIMCVLEKSPCDQLGRQLKGLDRRSLKILLMMLTGHISIRAFVTALPEVIVRNCRNCSPQQAQNAQKLTTFLQTKYPDVWAMLLRKYKT